MSAYQCECGSVWPAQSARDECRILDDIEDRNARKPNPKVTIPRVRWDAE